MALAWQAPARSYTALVILTKVRIQGYGRPASWLWILTFVRMTGLMGGAPQPGNMGRGGSQTLSA
jgi:hypothetical protein